MPVAGCQLATRVLSINLSSSACPSAGRTSAGAGPSAGSSSSATSGVSVSSLRTRAPGEETEFSAISVADISAGGVKIVGTNPQNLGDAVVISFERAGNEAVEFAARVAWSRDIEYGIMFAGAATNVSG